MHQVWWSYRVFQCYITSPCTLSTLCCFTKTAIEHVALGVHTFFITNACILFSSPHHLDSWQVIVTYKWESTHKSQASASKSRELVFKHKTAFKKQQWRRKSEMVGALFLPLDFILNFGSCLQISFLQLQRQVEKWKLMLVLSLILPKNDTWTHTNAVRILIYFYWELF